LTSTSTRNGTLCGRGSSDPSKISAIFSSIRAIAYLEETTVLAEIVRDLAGKHKSMLNAVDTKEKSSDHDKYQRQVPQQGRYAEAIALFLMVCY
jgi:hypothetical protein